MLRLTLKPFSANKLTISEQRKFVHFTFSSIGSPAVCSFKSCRKIVLISGVFASIGLRPPPIFLLRFSKISSSPRSLIPRKMVLREQLKRLAI